MSLHEYLLFLPACFALNLAFGPNNLLSVLNGTRHGVRVAVTAGLGRIVAFAIMIAISGVGMGALLLASEVGFAIVKFCGAAYLIWMGIRILRAHVPADGIANLAADTAGQDHGPHLGVLARQEFTTAISNPKAILIFTAFLPQFVVPEHYAVSYTEVGATFLLLEIVTVGIYGGVGRYMAHMANRGRMMQWLNRASGTMMIAFGILLALVRRPHTA